MANSGLQSEIVIFYLSADKQNNIKKSTNRIYYAPRIKRFEGVLGETFLKSFP